jgi:hypothetical protein
MVLRRAQVPAIEGYEMVRDGKLWVLAIPSAPCRPGTVGTKGVQ